MRPTLLIVDDHPGFRSLARRLLEAGGFEVVGEAADGHQAIAAARELRPDVVLLDIQLPDLDGFEVTARLADGEAGPVVVLTSIRDRADYGARVGRCGARGFIPKAELSGPAVHALLEATG
jgi:DNA-binding NarL/FixJ family response regulator